MSRKLVLRLTGIFWMIFSFACSAPKESKEPTLPPANPAEPEQKPVEIKVYDISPKKTSQKFPISQVEIFQSRGLS